MNASAPEIETKMVRGVGWMMLARFGVRGVGFLSTIILARLLVPEDFGLVALAMVVVAGLEAMSEFSFSVFLIAKQDSDRRHYDTIWTLSVLRGGLIAAVLFGGAPLFADFFGDPRIAPVAQWIAVATLVSSFENTGIINFQKELWFSRDFIWMMGAKLASFVVTIVLAFMWGNYWALVAGIIAGRTSRTVLSFLMHPFRPHPSLEALREVVNFSGWLLANNLILFIRSRSDQLILAKFLGARTLGVYSVAFDLASLIGEEALAPIRRVLLPGYSKVSGDPKRLAEMYLDSAALIAMLVTPFAIGLGLTADPIVRVILGEKWLDCIPLIEILSGFAFFNVWSTPGSPALLALKRPSILTWISMTTAILLVPLTALAAYAYGAPGVAATIATMAAVIMIVQWTVMFRLLPMSLMDLARRVWRIIVALAIMSAVVLAVRDTLPAAGSLVSTAFNLIALVVVGGVAYTGALAVCWLLNGRPDGPERIAKSFVERKLRKWTATASV